MTVVFGCCGCGMKSAIREVFEETMVDKLANEMQKLALWESEIALKKYVGTDSVRYIF